PQDISIVGYNDIPIVSHLPTPLTTLRVPFEQIASNALDLLAVDFLGMRVGAEIRISSSAGLLSPARRSRAFDAICSNG
ncbi:substrate-binding domain-containing protein, partial [Rhizobium ruizarguesonis]